MDLDGVEIGSGVDDQRTDVAADIDHDTLRGAGVTARRLPLFPDCRHRRDHLEGTS
jgi:hypothetical protein